MRVCAKMGAFGISNCLAEGLLAGKSLSEQLL